MVNRFTTKKKRVPVFFHFFRTFWRFFCLFFGTTNIYYVLFFSTRNILNIFCFLFYFFVKIFLLVWSGIGWCFVKVRLATKMDQIGIYEKFRFMTKMGYTKKYGIPLEIRTMVILPYKMTNKKLGLRFVIFPWVKSSTVMKLRRRFFNMVRTSVPNLTPKIFSNDELHIILKRRNLEICERSSFCNYWRKNRMLADFYIPRLYNDMKIAVEKKSFKGPNCAPKSWPY